MSDLFDGTPEQYEKLRLRQIKKDEENCVICGGSGGLYLVFGRKRVGPFCSKHRFDCSSDIHRVMVDYGFEQARIWIADKKKG